MQQRPKNWHSFDVPTLTAKPPVVTGSASADEIKADFDRVDQQPAGKLASFYKQFTRLDLPDKVIDSLLNDHVVEFRASLRRSPITIRTHQRLAPLSLIWPLILASLNLPLAFPDSVEPSKRRTGRLPQRDRRRNVSATHVTTGKNNPRRQQRYQEQSRDKVVTTASEQARAARLPFCG